MKLHRIYAQCEQYGGSLIFITLTMLPIAFHVFLEFPWYATLLVTMVLHLCLANRGARYYQDAALRIVSDHHLLNYIYKAMPMWTYHDSEPCGWANDMLGQLWEQLNVYVTKKARDKLDKIMEKSKPQMLKRMGIRKMGLGSIPPTIHSIRVFSQDIAKNKMEFEVDITWVSEFSMQLEIVHHGGAELLLEMCDLKFSGTLRVQCTPLIPDVPSFEYVRVTFMKPPVIDFSVHIGDGGGFDFVEPIAHAVQRALKRALVTIAQYPKWINILIDEKKKKRMDEAALCSYEHETFAVEPVGVLTVSVDGCNNLAVADLTTSDPFVCVNFMDEVHKTNIVYRSLNPRWSGECFDLLVYDPDAQSVNFAVWDYDIGTINNDFLGEVDVPISSLTPNVPKSIETNLYENLSKQQKLEGTIMLSMVYIPLRAKMSDYKTTDDDLVGDDDILFNVDFDGIEYDEIYGNTVKDSRAIYRKQPINNTHELTAHPAPLGHPTISSMGASMFSVVSSDDDDDSFGPIDSNLEHPVTGAVLISNISCTRLAHGDEKCDPYVSVSMGPIKRKTKVIKSSINPIFGESFTFVIRDPEDAIFLMNVKNNKKKLFGHAISRHISNGYVKFSLADVYPFLTSDVVASISLGTRKMEFELVGGKKGAAMGSISFTVKHISS